MRAGTGPTIGSSNRRIRFAVNRGFSHSHCLIRSRHGSRVPGRGGDTRTGGVGRPMARCTVLTSNFNRRATVSRPVDHRQGIAVSECSGGPFSCCRYQQGSERVAAPTRPERLRHLAVPFLDTIVNRGRVIPENGVDIKVVVNYYISHGSVVHKMEPDAGRPRS